MIEIAKEAALQAGKIIMLHRYQPHSVERKGTIDNITTEVDKLAESGILKILRKNFFGHNFWSEGTGRKGWSSDYTWIIDPLDGTGPFSLGMPFFGVSIGLIKKGELVLGVVNLPNLDGGSLYWAEKGKGAYLNGKKIEVSSDNKLEKVMIGYDFAWMGMRSKEIRKYLAPVVDRVRYTPFLGCTIAGLTYVARGVYGGYIHWGYVWDFAGGSAIIKEAGGIVTDTNGKDIDWRSETMSVIAGAPKVHKRLLSLIK